MQTLLLFTHLARGLADEDAPLRSNLWESLGDAGGLFTITALNGALA